MDPIFKALADSSRRLLLDRLHIEDSQTLRALCADLGMTRQAVTKHLVILEGAGLVKTTWQGREKLHHLDTTPLIQISANWIAKYAHHRSSKITSRSTSAKIPQRSTAPTPAEIDGESRWTNL